jgi:cytochrome oxidase complex assembly protein 1
MWKWFVGLAVYVLLASTAVLMPNGEWLKLVADSLAAALMVAAIIWFLRRRAARATAAGPSVGKASTWVSPADRRFIIGAILVGLVGGGAGSILVRSSDAYTLSMATARNSVKFTDALGSPVSEGWFSSSHFRYGETTTAELEVPVSGPKAHGSLRASAAKTGDKWQLHGLTLHLDSASGEIDLLK